MSTPISNVLMVTRELHGDRRYGLGRSLMPVVDTLIDRGWKVRYLCQEDLAPSAIADRGQWVERLGHLPGLRQAGHRRQLLGAVLERMQMGWFAARTARDQGYAAVHLHDPWLAWGFWCGVKRFGLHHVRWGITEHGFGSYSRATHEDGLTQGPGAQRWLRRVEASILNAADWVVAPTQLALDQLARDLALPFCPGHWRAIPHCAPQLAAMERSQARDMLGWSQRELHVLGVGRLVPLKRFDILIRACASVVKRHTSLHLHLLGEGDSAGLQHLADSLGFGSRVHFSVVDDVGPYYRAADVYASTSVTESFGLANFEALNAGLPCICTCVGGVPEVMGNGAWLVPVNVAAVTGALDELISNPALRQALSGRAAVQASAAMNLEQITDHYAELFRK